MVFIGIGLKSIGIYTTRHPGRDCRDPDAMDGNIELRKPFFSYMKLTFYLIFHIPMHWIPAIPAGMTAI
jgi:hypothetical protein